MSDGLPDWLAAATAAAAPPLTDAQLTDLRRVLAVHPAETPAVKPARQHPRRPIVTQTRDAA